MLRHVTAMAMLIGVLGIASHAQDLEKVQIETIALADDLVVLAGAGGNVAVAVGDRQLLLVDSGYPGLTEKLVASITKLSDLPVGVLVNTHWHFDHTGGNETFGRSGCTLIAHENVLKRMAKGQKIAVIDRDIPAAPAAALPVVTFTQELTIHLNEQPIVVSAAGPGHTDGDAIVVFQAHDVIHTGDLCFNGGYPFIDLSSGGSIDGMIRGIDAVLARCSETTRIIPGHGPMATVKDLKAYRAMLAGFRDIIAKEKAAGKSLEEIQEAKPTAELDARWGSTMFPPNVFTELVFRSLP